MKKIILSTLAVIIFAGPTVLAQPNSISLSKKIVQLEVDISTAKLKLSQSDYASPVVKVLVPNLADVSILDHRNTGEGAPCLATYDTLSPEDVIQNNPTTEKIDFTIELIKNVIPNTKEKTCDVFMVETVNGLIRGFQFNHYKQIHVGTRHIDDCR